MNINWKYILIVLILAIIVGGGIFYWSNQQDVSFTESISIKTQKEDISDWKIYHNEKYEFELKYPQDWKHEPDFPLTGERLSIVYKPEESQCGQGVGCFYPGRFFVGPILKSDLLPKQKDVNIPFIQYTQECIKELWEPGAILSTRNLTINGHPAIEISAITKKEGPASVFVPDMTILIEYSPTTVIWIEARYFPEYKDYVLSTYKTIFSTFKFIDNTSDWKTYRNEEYGFEFKYPANWKYSGSPEHFFLISPDLMKIEDLAHVPPGDISISILWNPSRLEITEFTKNYRGGWYLNYNSMNISNVMQRFSDIDASVKHIPLEALFIFKDNFVILFTLHGYTMEDNKFLLKAWNNIGLTFQFIE